MSPDERAKLAALIEADGDEGLRVHLLGAIGRNDRTLASRRSVRDLPPTWTQIHVLDRLEEAYEVLAGLPMVTRPKQYGNAMPTPFQEQRLSLLDQVLMQETGELEQLHEDRNRVRLSATAAQVSRMDQALGWPFEYLGDRPDLAKAISLRAMWSVMKVDIRKRCASRGIDHRAFNMQWQTALSLITGTLIARKVPVS
jgi:hypothetical protein